MSQEDLRSDMARYVLTAIRPGSVAYALKESMSGGEPAHYLCANCSKSGKKAILSCGEHRTGWYAFTCPLCKVSIPTGFRSVSPAQYAEEPA